MRRDIFCLIAGLADASLLSCLSIVFMHKSRIGIVCFFHISYISSLLRALIGQ